jgi:hypothetical protein
MMELLTLLVIGAFLWLLNVLQAWVQRQQREAARDAAREGGLPVPPVTPQPRPRQPVPQAQRPSRPEPVIAPMAVTGQRAPRRLGSRRDIRHGIVLMTILRPCRALEPPNAA